MTEWIKFSDRLPARNDADDKCEVLARFHPLMPWKKYAENSAVLDTSKIIERPCLWNWIHPHDVNAKELWTTNGFIEWTVSQSVSQGSAKEPS